MVQNTNKMSDSDSESIEKKPIVIKNATDLQRLKLEKLMKNPEKPVIIPDPPKSKNLTSPPDFVRNVMGSSAGAGSGEFHVYRHLRRKEYARQKFIQEKSEKKMRPTEEQNEALLEFLEQNPGITKGHLRTAMGKLQTKRKWQDLSIYLNSLGGAVKDGPGWAKYWTDKKYALKKMQSARNQPDNEAAEGQDFLHLMSPIEERMLALLGGSCLATGDRKHADTLIHNEDMEQIDEAAACTPVEVNVIELSEIFPQSSSPTLPTISTRPMQSVNPPRPTQAFGSTRQTKFRQRHNSGRPYSSRSLSQLRIERNRLIDIEARSVEAELLQAHNTASIACAINRLADAVITEKLDDEYHNKIEQNKREAEERTAKKRAKRLKKKIKLKESAKKPKTDIKQNISDNSGEDETDGECEEHNNEKDSKSENSA